MTATQDLIAAALMLADEFDSDLERPTPQAAEVREMCARAMVQPVGEVPMPEHDMRGPTGTGVYFNGYTPHALRTYGEQCRAAGYAAGVAACDVPEADFGNMLDCRTCAHFTADGCNSTVMCMEADQYKATVPRRYWATMSGEVKP